MLEITPRDISCGSFGLEKDWFAGQFIFNLYFRGFKDRRWKFYSRAFPRQRVQRSI